MPTQDILRVRGSGCGGSKPVEEVEAVPADVGEVGGEANALGIERVNLAVEEADAALWGSSENPMEDGSEALSSEEIDVLLRERAEAEHGYGSVAYYQAIEY